MAGARTRQCLAVWRTATVTANRITPEEVWQSLVCFAEAVCREIEGHSPDVILVLYKSGSVVWRAAETWWQMTRGTPLPPVVGANIGPSHFSGYAAEEFEWLSLEYADWVDVGHLVAWVLRHDDWLEALKQRITSGSGLDAPGSFLIVDDVIAEGGTTVIVKSLLWALYPGAPTSLVAGMPSDWRGVLGEAWLHEVNPYPMPPANDGWERSEVLRKHNIRNGSGFPWRHLISGLANTDCAPLAWTSLQPPHPVLTYLERYLPAEVWLQFPHWVATRTRQRLERQLESGANPLDTPPVICKRPWRLQRGVVEPKAFVCALAWMQTWVSMEEAAWRCNTNPSDLQLLVEECIERNLFVAAEVDGVAGFSLAPDVEPRTI